MEKLMIDSDVLINWLMKDREKGTNRSLWIAPTTILELGEAGQHKHEKYTTENNEISNKIPVKCRETKILKQDGNAEDHSCINATE